MVGVNGPKYLSDHLIYVGCRPVPLELPPWQGVLSSQHCLVGDDYQIQLKHTCILTIPIQG